jgi:cytochrome oxidase Cu insertion factor (SCO1/SenC/PrrC family)
VRISGLLAAGLLILVMMSVALADQGHSHGGSGGGASEPPRPAGFDYDPPKPGSYRLPPLATAADGIALDETGAERRLHDLMKQDVTVLSFIYTRCGDLCPLGTLLMRDLHEATAGDPDLAAGLRLITMSFDPDYDTPEVMAREAQALRGDRGADWVFLTARDKRELADILAAYDQRVLAKTDPDSPGGPLAHQLRVYLIDRKLRVRNIYSLDFLDPRLVMADIRTLKLEEAAESCGTSDCHDDLAEMSVGPHMGQGVGGAVEREDAVDRQAQAAGRDGVR